MDTMNSTIEERNKAIIKKVLFEGDNHNVAILEEVCSPDYKMYFPSTAEPLSLKEHIALWTAFNIAFPDLKHTVHESIAEGDFVTQRETLSGTHKGSFQGIPPTGKKIEMSATCIWRFSNGKIVEYWADGDMLGLMQQLGMELHSKTDHTMDLKEEEEKIKEVWYNISEYGAKGDWENYKQAINQSDRVQVIHPGWSEWLNGWEEFTAKYRPMLEEGIGWIERKNELVNINISKGGDMAWANVVFNFSFKSSPEEQNEMWEAVVFEKINGRWQVVMVMACSVPENQ